MEPRLQKAGSAFINRVQEEQRLVILFSFLLSNITSIFILTSYPFLQGTSDTSTYIALSREIIHNGMSIPSVNAIHYPGSTWVYPPVVPYIGALFLYITGAQGWSAYILYSIVGVELFSLTSIPGYLVVRELKGTRAAILFSVLYPFFLPSLYILSWGGYPQLAGFLMTAIAFYYLVLASHYSRKWIVYSVAAGIALGILALTHDLTFLAVFASLFLLLLVRFIFVGFGMNLGKNGLRIPALSLLVSSVFGLAWYLPRAWWVIDAAFPTSSSVYNKYALGVNLPPSFLSAVATDFQNITPPLGPLSSLWPILLLLVILLGLLLYTNAKELRFSRDSDFILALVWTSLILSLVELHNVVLFSRIMYFIFFGSFLLFPYLLLEIRAFLGGHEASAERLKPLFWLKKLVFAGVIVLIVVNSGTGLYSNYVSHSYYSALSNTPANQTSILSVLDYLHSSASSTSVAAAPVPVSFYIEGYVGIPVLSYQASNYLTQPVEWEESYAAYILIYHSGNNNSLTRSYIDQYHVTYVVIPVNTTGISPMFSLVFSSETLMVYST